MEVLHTGQFKQLIFVFSDAKPIEPVWNLPAVLDVVEQIVEFSSKLSVAFQAALICEFIMHYDALRLRLNAL